MCAAYEFSCGDVSNGIFSLFYAEQSGAADTLSKSKASNFALGPQEGMSGTDE